MPTVQLKWGARVFPGLVLDDAASLADVKAMLCAVTGVPPERQKLMSKAWKGILRVDEATTLADLGVVDGTRIALMGTAPSPPRGVVPARGPDEDEGVAEQKEAPEPEPGNEEQEQEHSEEEHEKEGEEEVAAEMEEEERVPTLTVLPARVAFLMSGHPRLGQRSPARRLAPYMRRQVLSFFTGGVALELLSVTSAPLLQRVATAYPTDPGAQTAVLNRLRALRVQSPAPPPPEQACEVAREALRLFPAHPETAAAAAALLEAVTRSAPHLAESVVPVPLLVAAVPACAQSVSFARDTALLLLAVPTKALGGARTAFALALLLLQHHGVKGAKPEQVARPRAQEEEEEEEEPDLAGLVHIPGMEDMLRGYIARTRGGRGVRSDDGNGGLADANTIVARACVVAVHELVLNVLRDALELSVKEELRALTDGWVMAVPGEEEDRTFVALDLLSHLLSHSCFSVGRLAVRLLQRMPDSERLVLPAARCLLHAASDRASGLRLVPVCLDLLRRHRSHPQAPTVLLDALVRTVTGAETSEVGPHVAEVLATVDGLLGDLEEGEQEVLPRVLRVLSALGRHSADVASDSLVFSTVLNWMTSGWAASQQAACRALRILYASDDVAVVRAGAIECLTSALRAGVDPTRVVETLATFRHHRPDILHAGALDVLVRLLGTLSKEVGGVTPGLKAATADLVTQLCTPDLAPGVLRPLAALLDRPSLRGLVQHVVTSLVQHCPDSLAAHAPLFLDLLVRALQTAGGGDVALFQALQELSQREPRALVEAGALELLLDSYFEPLVARGNSGERTRPVALALCSLLQGATASGRCSFEVLERVRDLCLQQLSASDPAALEPSVVSLLARALSYRSRDTCSAEMLMQVLAIAFGWASTVVMAPANDVLEGDGFGVVMPLLDVAVTCARAGHGAVEKLPSLLGVPGRAVTRTSGLLALQLMEAMDDNQPRGTSGAHYQQVFVASVVQLLRVLGASGTGGWMEVVQARLARKLSAPSAAAMYLELLAAWVRDDPSVAAVVSVLSALGSASPHAHPLSSIDLVTCATLVDAVRIGFSDDAVVHLTLTTAVELLERDANARERCRSQRMREAGLDRALVAAAFQPRTAVLPAATPLLDRVLGELGSAFVAVNVVVAACTASAVPSIDSLLETATAGSIAVGVIADLDVTAPFKRQVAETGCEVLQFFENASPALDAGFLEVILALLDDSLRRARDPRANRRVLPLLSRLGTVTGRGREVVERLRAWADEGEERVLCRQAVLEALRVQADIRSTPAVLVAVAEVAAAWLADDDSGNHILIPCFDLVAAIVGGAHMGLQDLTFGNRGTVVPPTGASRNVQICAEAVVRGGVVEPLARLVPVVADDHPGVLARPFLAAVGLLAACAADRDALLPFVSRRIVPLCERLLEDGGGPANLTGVRDIFRAVRDRQRARVVAEERLQKGGKK